MKLTPEYRDHIKDVIALFVGPVSLIDPDTGTEYDLRDDREFNRAMLFLQNNIHCRYYLSNGFMENDELVQTLVDILANIEFEAYNSDIDTM